MRQLKLGFSRFGFMVAVLQLAPNVVWALCPPDPNILKINASQVVFLEYGEHILGVSIVLLLLFLVRGEAMGEFPRGRSVLLCWGAILLYWACWVLYYAGLQGNTVIYALVLLPPLAFFLAGLAQRLYLISGVSALFTVFHVLVTMENFPLF